MWAGMVNFGLKNTLAEKRETIKRFFKPWVIVTFCLVLIAGGITFWRIKVKNQSTVSYQTAQVTKGTLTVSVSGDGNVVVDKRATVNPGISGKVTDLSIKVGDWVEKGRVLFKIENDQLDVSVSQAYISYLQAKQNVESSKSQLLEARNNQTTVNNKSGSTDEEKNLAAQKVTAAEIAVEIAEKNVDTAWSNYELQKDNANKRTVKAPISGTITTLNVTDGDQLGSSGSSTSSQSSDTTSSSSSSSSTTSTSSTSSSSAPVVIDDLGSLKASVSINEVDASQVKADQKVLMTFDAIDGLTLTGKVEQINTVGTESQGVVTFPATIAFDSLDERVKPQMSVSATITAEVKQDVLMAPNTAVKTQNDSHYVQIMENGKPRQQKVEIGSTNDTYTEITSGLKEGDFVVTQTVSAEKSQTATSSQSGGMNFPGIGGGGP